MAVGHLVCLCGNVFGISRWPRLEQNKENAFKLGTLVPSSVYGDFSLKYHVPDERFACTFRGP